MSDPAEFRMMDVVSMSARRSEHLHDEFDELFVAASPRWCARCGSWSTTAVWPRRCAVTFTELFRDWSRLRSHDRPDLWVRRVAIRRAQREATRRARRTVLEQAARGVALVDDGIRLPDRELIAAIRALPPSSARSSSSLSRGPSDGRGGRPGRLLDVDRFRPGSTGHASDLRPHSARRWAAMSVDQPIREGLLMTNTELPSPTRSGRSTRDLKHPYDESAAPVGRRRRGDRCRSRLGGGRARRRWAPSPGGAASPGHQPRREGRRGSSPRGTSTRGATSSRKGLPVSARWPARLATAPRSTPHALRGRVRERRHLVGVGRGGIVGDDRLGPLAVGWYDRARWRYHDLPGA